MKRIKAIKAIEAIGTVETMRTSAAAGRRTVDAGVAIIGCSSTGSSPRPVTMDGNYPRRRSDISARVVVDEAVVLDLGAAQIHLLNATASFIWHQCDGRCTVREIVEKLAGSFGVDDETAR